MDGNLISEFSEFDELATKLKAKFVTDGSKEAFEEFRTLIGIECLFPKMSPGLQAKTLMAMQKELDEE